MERQKTDEKDAVSTAADESIYNCDETRTAAAEEEE